MSRFLLYIILFTFFTNGYSQSKNSLVSKRSKTKKELQQTQSKLKKVKREKKENTSQLNELIYSIRNDKAEMQSIIQKVDSLRSSSQEKVHILHQTREVAYKNSNAKRTFILNIHRSYLQQKANNSIRVINQTTHGHASTLMGYFQRIQRFWHQLIDQLIFNLCLIKNEKATYTQIAYSKQLKINQLDSARKEKAVLLKGLHRQERTINKSIQIQQQQIEKLNKRIERIIYLQMRKNKSTKKRKGTTRSNSAFAKAKGTLTWPVNSKKIVRSFGKKEHPDHPGIFTNNNGIDIACSDKETVKAVFNGEVVGVFTIPGMQQAVMIKHADFFTTYSNVTNVCVKKGQKVGQSEAIAKCAKENDSNQFRLHFEIWQGKTKQNPMNWLK